jgi:hypothetical protein
VRIESKSSRRRVWNARECDVQVLSWRWLVGVLLSVYMRETKFGALNAFSWTF